MLQERDEQSPQRHETVRRRMAADGQEEPERQPGRSRWHQDDGDVEPPASAAAKPHDSTAAKPHDSTAATAARSASGSGGKRKHSPIVWGLHTKAARVDEAPHAATSARPAVQAQGPSAAEIAQAEIEDFRQRQAAEREGQGSQGGQGDEPYMKPSPDVSSSEEEEEHIRREGNSPHAAREERPVSGGSMPVSRWGLGESVEEGAGAGAAAGGREVDSGAEGARGGAGWQPDGEGGGRLRLEEGADAAAEAAGEGGGSRAHAPQREHGGEEAEEAPSSPPPLPKKRIGMALECRSVDCYEKLNRISEGTYGVVYRARDRETGEVCALKKVKLEKERDGFPLTSVREINILLSLAHPNIVNVSEVVVGSSLDAVFMVMEYADHDLKSVMERRLTQPFSTAEVKCLMLQLLAGTAYLHDNWVLHRDLKTSNILYTNRGQLKICDFGLARQYGSPLKPYTHLVVTLWYRAPELLLEARTYSTAVDVWSCGCIMAELLLKAPLFTGKNELAQIDQIFKTLGTPTTETWPGVDQLPHFRKFNFKGSARSVLRQRFPPPGPIFDGRPTLSESGFDLLRGLLELCPEQRLTAQEALEHPWFMEHPLPKDVALMPTFPGTNESLHGHGARKLGDAGAP